MKIKLHHFALSLFLSLGMAVILLWSVSLFLLTDGERQRTTRLYQDSWRLQLDQLQLAQRLRLLQSYYELSDGLESSADAEARAEYIDLYSQRNPQIALIQLQDEPIEAGIVESEIPSAPAFLCEDLPASRRLSVPRSLTVIPCLYKQRPMLGVSATMLHSAPRQQLILLSDYFSFMAEFERLTGKHLVSTTEHDSIQRYIEQPENSGSYRLTFSFNQAALNLGSLTISLPLVSFRQLWLQQAVWMIPLVLGISMLMYYLLFRALIHPLFMIMRRMKKVVLTRRPGSGYDSKFLTPGLTLLHRYFMHLTQMTKHDPLTGLHNRAIFEERLQQAMLDGKRSGRKYALVLVDINNFHRVNKQWGHYVGDGLLKQLAKRMISNLRESDSLARLEQDNFAFLLPFVDDNQLSSLAQKLYQALAEPYTVYGRLVRVGISMALAVYPDHAQDLTELELKASEALLQAHKGDWPVVFARSSSEQSDYSGLSLIQSLRQALNDNAFNLVYQPVVDLRNHRTSYFEALLRWQQPDRHTQSIEQTIALAEKNQLIRPLTQWIIETACRQLKTMGDSEVRVAVNLSMLNLHDDELPGRIAETLSQSGVMPDRLMIEITEGQIMQEPEQVIGILTQLSAMGISLSIDDFGTGQASLTYLKKLPVEKLKIDQSFVKDMVSDEEDRAIVLATIKLAHTLGIEVVAEGVESDEIHQLLIQMGCDYVQGFYISRPLESAQIDEWMALKDEKSVS